MFEITGVSAGYVAVPAIKDLTLNVKEKEMVALIGGNGAGKTTLVRVISGLLKPIAGVILLDDIELTALPPHKIVDNGVIQVPEGRMLFPMMSVRDNLLIGARNIRAKNKISSLLDKVHQLFPILKSREYQAAGTLSGGEQQMVAIARGLMAAPKLLLLDEPSLGLAPLMVDRIFDALTEVKREQLAIFLIEQNVALSLSISDRGYVIENGQIVLSDSAESLLQSERLKKAYLGI